MGWDCAGCSAFRSAQTETCCRTLAGFGGRMSGSDRQRRCWNSVKSRTARPKEASR